MTTPPIKISEEALRLAREFVASPDEMARVLAMITASGLPGVQKIVENAIIVSRELLRVAGESE